MRFAYFFMFAAAAAGLLASPARASSEQQDHIACDQENSNPDLQLKGCTRLLALRNLTNRIRSNVYLNRANAWFDKDDYDRAIADYNEALRLDPKFAFALNGRGNAWRKKGELDRAIADYNEAIHLDPKNSFPYNGRATAWFEKGDFDRGIADFSVAIDLNPKEARLYNNRALLWSGKGDYDQAIADCNEAIRLEPQYPQAYNNRGDAWRLKGDLDRALADQDRAIQLHPGFSSAYVSRADVYRYRGDFDRSLADYDQALRLWPDLIPALVGRGLTYEKMGDAARARAEFKKALASPSQFKGDEAKSALKTAGAQLAGLDSGAPQPVIPAAPSKAVSATSIPTPTLVVPSTAAAAGRAQGRRVALVIGNSADQNVPVLLNPQRDALAVAASLRAIGFETVTVANDTTREKLIDALRTFAEVAEKADWAMVYYAGHGMEMSGVNYLIPVDALLKSDRDVQFAAVPLDQVMASLEGTKKLKLILLDACRDNPFAPQMRRTATPDSVAAAGSTAAAAIGTRSIGRGLAEVKVTGATLVVYAAKNGQVALDGEGGDSPFAVAVVQRIATPGVEINKVFRLVRDDVMEATAGRQEPYTYGSLPGKDDFFFVAK